MALKGRNDTPPQKKVFSSSYICMEHSTCSHNCSPHSSSSVELERGPSGPQYSVPYLFIILEGTGAYGPLLLAPLEGIYSTVQYSTVHYNTIQYNTIQYNTIQYNTIQYNTIQYNTIQYNTIQYNTIQYNTIQYNTIQYNTIQYNTIQYNTVQYSTVQ